MMVSPLHEAQGQASRKARSVSVVTRPSDHSKEMRYGAGLEIFVGVGKSARLVIENDFDWCCERESLAKIHKTHTTQKNRASLIKSVLCAVIFC